MQLARRLSSSITDLLLIKKKTNHFAENVDTTTIRHPLHLAVAMNDQLKIQQLLDSGYSDLDDEDDRGRIPFQIAVLGKNVELVQFLIDQGSCIDHADYNQTTAAHFCITYNKFEAFQLLLDAGADFLQVDKCSKSAFDLACEYGRNEMLNELIDQGVVQEVIRRVNTSVRLNNTCFHLAARNGHVDICYKLLEMGFNINVTTDKGSALHEAISGTHIQVVRLLLHLGIDHRIVNRNQQTAKMLAEKCSEQMSVSGSLINTLLQQYPLRIYGTAIKDYEDSENPSRLCFQANEKIWIIDRSNHRFWKGIVFESSGGRSKCGFFPPYTIEIDEVCSAVDSMPGIHPFRSKDKMTIRKMKRVDVPQVPELHGMSEIVSRRSRHFSSGSYSSSNALPTEHGAMELKSFCHSSSASSSRAPSCCADHSDYTANGDPRHSIGVGSAMSTSSRNYGTLTTFQSKNHSAPFVPTQLSHNRNSTSSSSSSSGIESLKALSQVATSNSSTSFNSTSFISDDSPTNCPDRMQKSSPYASSQSSHRHSSAGSDTSSRPRSQCAHFNSLPCNIGEMIAQGIPDAEIISNWLEGLGMQQYLSLFITQGYDVASVARLTSEDLLALGITDPKNRRKVYANIQEWNVVDNWPTAVQPTDSAAFWLIAIGLQQYVRLFESEGYCLMEDLQNISFEDLEDMGIKKLGHIKRICLALKKIKLARNQSSVVSPPAFTNSRSNNSQFHSPDSGYTDISNNSILTNQRPRLSSQIYESRRSMLPSNETDYSTYKNPSFRSDTSDSYNMPKLRIYTTQEILSATSDLPRSVNGDIMTIPTLDFDYDAHRSRVQVPPPAPVPQSARPDLSFDFLSGEINGRNGSSLHGSPHQTIRSGTFRSQPSTPARHLSSFISNGRDPGLVLDELNSDLRAMNLYK